MTDRSYSPSRRLNLSPQSTPDKSNHQMEGLLTEFRRVYEAKLRRLDEAERNGQDTQKVKDCTLY